MAAAPAIAAVAPAPVAATTSAAAGAAPPAFGGVGLAKPAAAAATTTAAAPATGIATQAISGVSRLDFDALEASRPILVQDLSFPERSKWPNGRFCYFLIYNPTRTSKSILLTS